MMYYPKIKKKKTTQKNKTNLCHKNRSKFIGQWVTTTKLCWRSHQRTAIHNIITTATHEKKEKLSTAEANWLKTASALSRVRHVLTAVSVAVSAMAVESGGGGDLHLQLLALGGVGRHGVAVVRPQAALALSPHRLSQLIGCVRAGAPAAQTGVLPVARTRMSIPQPRCYSNR